MRTIISLLISAMAIPALVAATEPAQQISADMIQVLKIAAQDERAVIKTLDGKMQIIKIGDPIGDRGKVLEIAADRIVIEEKKNTVTEKVIIRLVNGKQKVERLRKTGEQSAPLLAPAVSDKITKKQDKSFK